MRKTVSFVIGAILLAGAAWSGSPVPEEDRKGIMAAALGYMDGALDSDATRVGAAVHTELTKVTPMTLPETGKTALRSAGYSRLVELVRAKAIHLEEGSRGIEAEIFDVREGIACAKVVSSRFYDYLHLVKIDGQWKILNVLWVRNGPGAESAPSADQRKKDEEGIRAAALDYLEGYFGGDADRIERALHTELTKVRPAVLPQTGKTLIDKVGAGLLVEYTRTQGGLLAEDQRNIEIEVYDIQENVATAGAMSSMFFDYLQLVKSDGRWRIVNVLWTMNPGAPAPKEG